MKNVKTISIIMIVLGVISYGLNTLIGNFSLQIKLGFMGKVLFISGIILFWLFVILGKNDKKQEDTN